jgi:putative flavoprotein involved in K+ transport
VAGQTIIVGSGPAGLATAAMLRKQGVPALVLEREPDVAASWRGRYDGLHLHTVRSLSSLPGMRLPRTLGRFVSRDAFVEYLERYAAGHRIAVQPATRVTRIDREAAGLRVRTDTGDVEAAAVVVATGHQHTPTMPAWPGRDGYAGRLLHSSRYANAAPFAGMRVLVAGTGNSGADIAVELAGTGARQVWVAMRQPPHIIPRQRFGVPAQVLGVGLRHAPAAAADPLVRVARRALVGDLRSLGLPAPSEGLLAHNRRTGAVPLLDVDFVAALRAGRFRIVAAVRSFDGAAVRLADGSAVTPDAVVACTGFATGLGELVGHLGVLDPLERPLVHAAAGRPRVPGLWFTGFRTPISGALRELRFEAPALARAIGSA